MATTMSMQQVIMPSPIGDITIQSTSKGFSVTLAEFDTDFNLYC